MTLALFVWTIGALISLVVVCGFVLGMLGWVACQGVKGAWRKLTGQSEPRRGHR